MELGVGSPALGHDLDLIFWVVGDVVELPVEVVLVLVLPSVWTREDLPVLGQDFALSLVFGAIGTTEIPSLLALAALQSVLNLLTLDNRSSALITEYGSFLDLAIASSTSEIPLLSPRLKLSLPEATGLVLFPFL